MIKKIYFNLYLQRFPSYLRRSWPFFWGLMRFNPVWIDGRSYNLDGTALGIDIAWIWIKISWIKEVKK